MPDTSMITDRRGGARAPWWSPTLRPHEQSLNLTEFIGDQVDSRPPRRHPGSVTEHTDLIVVGAGIIGLASAFLAREQGQSVRVIDAADRPVGSSIQNFGHACFTAQADVIQPVARVAREGWLRAAQQVGFWAKESGTWLPATSEIELQVLAEFAEYRGDDLVKLLSREEVAAGIGNPGLDALGGAHLPLDVRVDPREAAPAIARYLAADGVEFTWNTQVTGIADGTRAGAVVLDPPRAGAGRGVVEAISALHPEAVVYVACDPVALARDLGTFRALGWNVSSLRAFDLFPHSHHVEAVALLSR